MRKDKKQFFLNKFSEKNFNLEALFIVLIFLGIPMNLYKNRFYDNSWTIGEWLISYEGGFVRRGLPGEVVYLISEKFKISPIILIWFLSVLSIASLFFIVNYFCRNYFPKYFLLSQLIILGPISEDYLVRKDAFLVLMYGMSLFSFKAFSKKHLSKTNCILLINLLSIISILSHEAYGIWALPSLFIIFFIFEKLLKRNNLKSLFNSTLNLSGGFIAFLLCWFFKGGKQESILIHQSWQSLSNILPSIGALNEINPSGAIDAIGWGTSQVYSSSLLSQFNLLIFWHPAMWLLTIFIAMRLFIGYEKDLFQKGKRSIICIQLLAFIPLFLFVDIGRWIFMWISSSALLFGFLNTTFGADKIITQINKLKFSEILPNLIPAFNSPEKYKMILLLIGIPHCCWSLGRYLISNPIGFGIKNIIFYLKFLSP